MCTRCFITTVYSFSKPDTKIFKYSFAKPQTCLANLASPALIFFFFLTLIFSGKEKEEQVSQSLMFHWENFMGVAALKDDLKFVLFRGKCLEVKFNLEPKHILC